MASSSKRKGDAFEREIVSLHAAENVPARKVPLSGACGGAYAGDVIVGPLETGRGYKVELVCECKKRKTGDGFKQLERWLGDANVLFLRRNNSRPLVAMDWPVWAMLTRQLATHPSPPDPAGAEIDPLGAQSVGLQPRGVPVVKRTGRGTARVSEPSAVVAQ